MSHLLEELYTEALPVIEESQKDSIEHGFALLNYAELLVNQLREIEVWRFVRIEIALIVVKEGVKASKEACRIIRLTHKDDSFLAAAMSNYASCTSASV